MTVEGERVIRRNAVLIGVAVVVLAAAGSVALANVAGGFGERSFTPTQVVAGWDDNSASMTSQTFAPIPMSVDTSGHGPATVTFTGQFSGGQIGLRIMAHGHALKPGVLKFDPTVKRSGYSFTFVWPGGAGKCNTFRPQWRSVTGDRVRMDRADIVVTYQHPKQSGGCA